MAFAIDTYTGDGSTVNYSVTFPYVEEAHVVVTLDGVTKTLNTDYSFTTSSTITFTTAPSASAVIKFIRNTSQTSRLVDYQDGSTLTEATLDQDGNQSFYMAQEAIDITENNISLSTSTDQWDADNKRITNLANPVNNNDAVNKTYLENTWLSPSDKTTLNNINANISNINAVNSNEANINSVNSNEANINTVATNIGSVNTVATDIAKVITVANDLAEAVSEVETVADDLNEATSEIDTVANNITNVNTVGTNISNVNTVAGVSSNVTTVAGISSDVTSVANDATDIGTVATNITNVNNVATDIANVNSVAGNSTNINAVAGNATNINAVNANSSNINTVAGINADVTTVANDGTDIGTVATNIANVNTVAGNNANITTVAGNDANITTVAGISSNVTTVANDQADIGTVATDISNVNTVAGSIANVNTVATNVSDVNNFADRYRVQAGEPSVDNDEGDLVYDTNANAVKVYNGTSFDTIQQGITDVAPTRHSIRPSLNLDFANSKVLDPRITFTRASNATYYDGYTSVKAEENLLPYSQEIDNSAWSKFNTTVTANTETAPDGTTTADTLTANGGTNAFDMVDSSGTTEATITVSAFLKQKGTQQYVFLGITYGFNNTWVASIVDLTNGTITSDQSGADATHNNSTITDAGNGWYRVSVTGTNNTTVGSNTLRFGFVPSGTSTISSYARHTYTTSGTVETYFWGGQLEVRDNVTAYTATSGTPITKYQPALQTAGNNVARFDHNPTTGESLGLLIEESRTNTQIYSEEFNNGAWNKLRSSITSNTIIAPDGTLTADKLVEDTSTNSHFISDNFTLVDGTTYTMSLYAKAGEREGLSITNGGLGATFNLLNGNVNFTNSDSVGFAINFSASTVYVGNGWYRCIVSSEGDTNAGSSFRIALTNSATYSTNSQQSYTGDGYSGAYIWGAQLEEASFPTSYIKTTGSQVTRSGDDVRMTGTNFTDWYNQKQGTILTDFKLNHSPTLDTNKAIWVLYEGVFGTADNMELGFYSTTGRLRLFSYNSSGSGYSGSSDIYPSNVFSSERIQTVTSFSNDGAGLAYNGNIGTTGTFSMRSVPKTELLIGRSASSSGRELNGHFKKFSYYPIKLTDNEITDLSEE